MIFIDQEASSCPEMIFISIPVSVFTLRIISAPLLASRIAEVAQAFTCFTSYTSKKQFIALHCLDDLFNFIRRYFTFVKYFKSETKWSTDKCYFYKFGVTLWAYYYIRNKKSCCIASNINCCQSQRLQVFGFFYKDIYRFRPG